MSNPKADDIAPLLAALDRPLTDLAALHARPRSAFDGAPQLRKQAERSFDDAVKRLMAVARQVIVAHNAPLPAGDPQAIQRLGELGVISAGLAARLAPLTGIHNLVVQAYLGMRWDEIYACFQNLDDLRQFREAVDRWLQT